MIGTHQSPPVSTKSREYIAFAGTAGKAFSLLSFSELAKLHPSMTIDELGKILFDAGVRAKLVEEIE